MKVISSLYSNFDLNFAMMSCVKIKSFHRSTRLSHSSHLSQLKARARANTDRNHFSLYTMLAELKYFID